MEISDHLRDAWIHLTQALQMDRSSLSRVLRLFLRARLFQHPQWVNTSLVDLSEAISLLNDIAQSQAYDLAFEPFLTILAKHLVAYLHHLIALKDDIPNGAIWSAFQLWWFKDVHSKITPHLFPHGVAKDLLLPSENIQGNNGTYILPEFSQEVIAERVRIFPPGALLAPNLDLERFESIFRGARAVNWIEMLSFVEVAVDNLWLLMEKIAAHSALVYVGGGVYRQPTSDNDANDLSKPDIWKKMDPKDARDNMRQPIIERKLPALIRSPMVPLDRSALLATPGGRQALYKELHCRYKQFRIEYRAGDAQTPNQFYLKTIDFSFKEGQCVAQDSSAIFSGTFKCLCSMSRDSLTAEERLESLAAIWDLPELCLLQRIFYPYGPKFCHSWVGALFEHWSDESRRFIDGQNHDGKDESKNPTGRHNDLDNGPRFPFTFYGKLWKSFPHRETMDFQSFLDILGLLRLNALRADPPQGQPIASDTRHHQQHCPLNHPWRMITVSPLALMLTPSTDSNKINVRLSCPMVGDKAIPEITATRDIQKNSVLYYDPKEVKRGFPHTRFMFSPAPSSGC